MTGKLEVSFHLMTRFCTRFQSKYKCNDVLLHLNASLRAMLAAKARFEVLKRCDSRDVNERLASNGRWCRAQRGRCYSGVQKYAVFANLYLSWADWRVGERAGEGVVMGSRLEVGQALREAVQEVGRCTGARVVYHRSRLGPNFTRRRDDECENKLR